MQKQDFNLKDAFQIFENKLDVKGIKEGLDAIGVYPTKKEVDNFISRYDRNRDGKLTFEDFAEAFTPMDDYYAHMLTIRPSNHRLSTNYRKDDCFNAET